MFAVLDSLESFYKTKVSKFIAISPCICTDWEHTSSLNLSRIKNVPISIITGVNDPICSVENSELIFRQLLNTQRTFSQIKEASQTSSEGPEEEQFIQLLIEAIQGPKPYEETMIDVVNDVVTGYGKMRNFYAAVYFSFMFLILLCLCCCCACAYNYLRRDRSRGQGDEFVRSAQCN